MRYATVSRRRKHAEQSNVGLQDLPPSGEKQIIVCGRISGLGDMLQQAAKCALFAERHGIDCFIDWRKSFYSRHGDNINLFKNMIYNDDLKCITELNDYESHLARCKNVDDPKEAEKLFDLNFEFGDQTSVYVSCPIPALQPSDYFRYLGKFYFPEDVYQAASSFMEKIDSRRLIGIHYRHGNGEFSETKPDYIVRSEIETIYEKYKKLSEQYCNSMAFVSTDSIISYNIFREVFDPSEMIVFDKSFLPPQIGPMHYANFLDETLLLNSNESLFSTLVEMVIMSKCSMIFRAHFGSFPDWSCSKLLENNEGRADLIIKYEYARNPFQSHKKSFQAFQLAVGKVLKIE